MQSAITSNAQLGRAWPLYLAIAVSLCVPRPSYGQQDSEPTLAPLTAGEQPDAEVAELGRMLFFDGRLSGDATTSCATCHQPDKAWTDGLPLSKGYPGTLYFRNTPTLLNAHRQGTLYWDGRLSGRDLPTLVRDHISEAHFMQADGRLVIERLRQVPEYERRFEKVFGGEPTYGRILSSVAAFVQTLNSQAIPLNLYLQGEQDAISADAKAGLELFRGKAGCSKCHHGPMLSDGKFHNLGLRSNPEIIQQPMRHISLRRFFRTLGTPAAQSLRRDVGLFAITKQPADRSRFRTPSLWEVGRTAPYMHDGQFKTLGEVIDFYNQGGGALADEQEQGKSELLKPLQLTHQEKTQLLALLSSMSGESLKVTPVPSPPYELRKRGEN